MLDYIKTLLELALNPNIVFSFLLVGAIYWTVITTVFITLRLHTKTNNRSFVADMEVIANDPKALASYYGMRLVAYALIAAACVFAAP
jgi:hypothetical protein